MHDALMHDALTMHAPLLMHGLMMLQVLAFS
jgi:hypothetical protein